MSTITRKEFLDYTAKVAATSLLSSLALHAKSLGLADKKIKVAVIGCGSVSGQYFPHLSKCPYVELVSACDIIPERAKAAAEKYNVPNWYPHIDKMLAGAKFDMMITLTDMQEHGRLNKQALMAGHHVWSEKPMANTYKEGRELLDLAKSKNLRIWVPRPL
jgi:predicted dehydrogenase